MSQIDIFLVSSILTAIIRLPSLSFCLQKCAWFSFKLQLVSSFGSWPSVSPLALQMLFRVELEFSMEGLEESFVKVKLGNANIWTHETWAVFYFNVISKRCQDNRKVLQRAKTLGSMSGLQTGYHSSSGLLGQHPAQTAPRDQRTTPLNRPQSIFPLDLSVWKI